MSSTSPATALGTAAVLSVADAAAWLPMPAADAEAWLRSVRVVRKLGVGQRAVEVVIWGDVLGDRSATPERFSLEAHGGSWCRSQRYFAACAFA